MTERLVFGAEKMKIMHFKVIT